MAGWGWDDDLPHDPLASKKAENTQRQTVRLAELVAVAIVDPEQVPITVQLLQEINRIGVDGLIDDPDVIRIRDNEIVGSRHQTPPWQEVPRLLHEMCDYLNNGPNRDAVHLAAYAMWRINWIHPFADGNGRTARSIAYLTLCAMAERELRGDVHFVELIMRNERAYWRALEAADAAALQGRVDVSALEKLIVELIGEQLATDPEATS